MILAIAVGFLAAGASPCQMPDAPVVVAPVVRDEIRTTRPFVGTVLPLRRSAVGSEAEGRVVEFLAEAGARVRRGDLLARLRTTDIEIAVRAAKAELRLREAELKELEAGPRKEEIAASRARLEAARAERAIRAWTAERSEDLFRKDSITEENLQKARRELERAEALLSEAGSNLAVLEAGTRPERIAQAAARVDAQREAVHALEDDLGRREIRAPFDGWVTAEMTEVGAWLPRGGVVAELAELDAVEVEVPVPEEWAAALKPSASVLVRSDALAGTDLHGTIAAIIPQADVRSRTLPVRVRVVNEPGGRPALVGGMSATVILPGPAKESALLVPKDALVLGGPAPVVYVTTPSPANGGGTTVRMAPVTTGPASGRLVAVTGPIAEGDLVVVRGNERLFPGQAVNITSRIDPRAEPETRPERR